MIKKLLKITAILSLAFFVIAIILVAKKSPNGNSVETKLAQAVSNDITKIETEVQNITDPSPTPTPTSTPTSTKTVPDTRCIITVNGKKYDVTSYRNKHPGGDIFTCGTDMTKVFYSQHSNSTLSKMQKYLIQ